jgi:hypothetical protein
MQDGLLWALLALNPLLCVEAGILNSAGRVLTGSLLSRDDTRELMTASIRSESAPSLRTDAIRASTMT